MNELQFIAALGAAVLLFLGTLYTVRATRGRTQSDYKTSFEKRIDDKMFNYTEGLEKRVATAEERVDAAEADATVLKERVVQLEVEVGKSTHREKLLYRYTAKLREHIIGGFQPPPPPVPEELVEWYETFEAGQGLA